MTTALPELQQSFGVALFDNPNHPSAGWAAISGEAAFRFCGINDLRTSVIWIVNSDMRVMHERQLLDSPRLRPDHFLRTRINTLITELGLKQATAEVQATHLSVLVNQIMQITFLHTGLDTAPRLSLNNGLRQAKLPSLPAVPVSTAYASKEATQTYVGCEVPRKVEGELVSLTFHRARYAQRILAHDLPFGRWTELNPSEMSASNDALNNMVSESVQPLLIELDITHIDKSINHLVNWGSGAGREVRTSNESHVVTMKRRTWMTSHEYSYLKPYMQCTIKNIHRGESFGVSPVVVPVWHKSSLYSYAFQIYCENLWTSLTRSIDGNPASNPLAAWVHSIDRMLCLEKARALESEGWLTIRHYGYGRIVVEVPNHCIDMVPELALKHHLISNINPNKQLLDKYQVRDFSTAAQHMQIIFDQGKLSLVETLSNRSLTEAIKGFRELQKQPQNALGIRF
jgi:hypothetical protein